MWRDDDIQNEFSSWNLKKFLGKGAFGEVALWENQVTKQKVAVKRLKSIDKLAIDEIAVLRERWLKELQWMQSDDMIPYIVRNVNVNDPDFLDYLRSSCYDQNPFPAIMMEFCNAGDLRSDLNKIENLNGLTEFEVRNILCALRYAVEHLHKKCNIEHRDIKPENILMHIEGNNKSYKLGDFGYARQIPNGTNAQSVVGTGSYVAPEVIVSNCYNETVDYWSIGNVAYEIICGKLPFIPHQSLKNRINAIQKKSPQCISIAQKINNNLSEDNDLEFFENVVEPNRSSNVFISHIEKWLRLSLDKTYKTRGRNDKNELRFYADLDDILDKQILTTFSLKNYKQFYYDIKAFDNLKELIYKLATDSQIDVDNIFLIYPTLHPKKQCKSLQDLYVHEWCDTSDPQNPPVMLFVNEFELRHDVDIARNFDESETIRKCMSIDPEGSVPLWLLQQFEREVHFILTREQNYLKCYLMGLHTFVMRIEHEVFLYEQEIADLNDKALQLKGCLKMFNKIIEFLKNNKVQLISELVEKKAMEINMCCEQLKATVVPQIRTNYRSILNFFKEMAKNDFFQQYAKNDIFGLDEYRKFLSGKHSDIYTSQCAWEKCTIAFSSFFNGSNRKTICESINRQIKEFNLLRQIVPARKTDIAQLENVIEELTLSLANMMISSPSMICDKNESPSSLCEMDNILVSSDTLDDNNSNLPNSEARSLAKESMDLINIVMSLTKNE